MEKECARILAATKDKAWQKKTEDLYIQREPKSSIMANPK
jgi:hypothetical protein